VKEAFLTGWLLITCGVLLTSCVHMHKPELLETKNKNISAFGLIKVRPVGPYSRGYETQLRFFHVLDLQTQERIQVYVRSSAQAFGLSLNPGQYEVTRVRINEGPMSMESHVSLPFEVFPDRTTYLGTWKFDVDCPRTQRMLRMDISDELPRWEEMPQFHQSLKNKNLVASLPKLRTDEVRLYVVPPYPRVNFYYR